MRICRSWETILAITLGLQLGAFAPQTQAATLYWSGSNTWNTSTSNKDWGSNSTTYTGRAWVNSSTANFGGTAGTVTVSATAGSLSVGAITFATDGYTLTGGTLSFSADGNGVTTGSGADTISAVLANYNGLPNGFSKLGAGTLILSGDNDSSGYGGNTTITAGTVQLGNAGALGSGAVNLGNFSGGTATSGTLDLNGYSPDLINSLGVLTGNPGTLTNSSGTASTIAAPIVLYSGLIVNTPAGNITLSGSIGTNPYNYAVTKTGTGTLILSGDSSGNAGPITMNQGTLQVGSPTALGTGEPQLNGGTLDLCGYSPTGFSDWGVLSSAAGTLTNSSGSASTITAPGNLYNGLIVNTPAGNITLSGSITGAYSYCTLTKTGAGTLILSGDNSGYAQQMVINQGTLQMGSATALGTGGAFLNGGTLDLCDYSPTITPFAVISGSGGTLTNSSGTAATYSGSFPLYNPLTVNTPAGNITLSGSMMGAYSYCTLTKTGAGTLILSGDNSGYARPIVIDQGTLQVGSATALGTNSAQLNGGTLDLNGISPTGLGNIAQLSSYSGTLTNSSGTASTVANNVYLYNNMYVNTANGNITLQGALINGTNGTLTKTGTGTLILSGNSGSNYSGVIYINQGTLQVGSATALGTNSASLNGGTLDLDGISPTGLGNIAQLSNYSGTLTNSSGTASTVANTVYLYNNMYVNTTNGNITLSGTLINGTNGTLTKTGAGTLILSGNSGSSYSAATVINQGTVQLGSATALGTNSAQLNGGTLDLCGISPTGLSNIAQLSPSPGTLTNSSGTASTVASPVYLYNNMFVNTTNGNITLSGTITGAYSYSTLTKTGTGTLILSGNSGSNYVGVSYINQGTVQVGSATALGTGGAYLNGGTLDLNGYSPTTPLAVLSSYAGTLTNSSGTASTYSGSFPLYNGLTVNTAAGNITLSGNITGTLSAVSLTQTGTGRLILSGSNTYTGPTTVQAGALELGLGASPGAQRRRRR